MGTVIPIYTAAFWLAFTRTVGSEGGYVNNPKDPGGETKFGISKNAYPNVNIAALTRDDAMAIYFRDYWTALQLDNLASMIAFQVFDAAVNHGLKVAVILLQSAVGATVDGSLGPATITAAKQKPPAVVAVLIVAARINYWTQLTTWPTFGKGWARRAAADLQSLAQDLTAS